MPDPDEAKSFGASRGQGSDVDTRFAHRNLGGAWLLSLVVVPLVLAALLTVLRGDTIEADLQERSLTALQAAGLDSVAVEFVGRDALVTGAPGVSGADLGRAREVVVAVEGVRAAERNAGSLNAGSDASRLAGLVLPVWLFLALAFLVGSLAAWLVVKVTLPSEKALEAETGIETEGLLS
jgi:hypothetical protein